MVISKLATSLVPGRGPSPLPGTEHVRGFGIPALLFNSGHVLGLRAFAQTDFGPYRSLWHRDPSGAWTIHVDGVALAEACPRYFGASLRASHPASISLEWCGPAELRVTMDDPRLDWNVKLGRTPLLAAMNAILPLIRDGIWSRPSVPRLFERMAGSFLGSADMLATVPNGHLHLLAPQRMFLVTASRAVLAEEDLGAPIHAPDNPRIGPWRLPARGVFAMGRGYFYTPIPQEQHVAE